jgi:hypothetical protein
MLERFTIDALESLEHDMPHNVASILRNYSGNNYLLQVSVSFPD